MATQTVSIYFTAPGVPVVIKSITDIGKTAKTSASSVNYLQSALGLIGTAVTIKGILEMADAMTNIRNRLGFVSSSTDEAAVAQERLLDVANRSRTGFEATVELYSRVALSTQQLGLSHEQVARSVETLNKAVVLSGANQREAEAAIIQFSQGLAQGALRGQELRSVMQQIPFVADLIAKKLGVTRGALRDLGAEGKISAKQMIDALLGASDKVDAEFGKTFPTLEQSFTILKNLALKFVDDLNQKYGIVPKLSAALDFLGKNLDVVGRVLLAGIFTSGVLVAVAAINTLTVALLANPFTAVAAAITITLGLLVLFSDRIKLAADSQATLADFMKALFQETVTDLKYLGESFRGSFQYISDLFHQVFGGDFELSLRGGILLVFRFRDVVVGTVKGLYDSIIIIFQNLPPALEALFVGAMNGIGHTIELAVNGYIETVNALINSTVGQKIGLSPISLVKFNEIEASQQAQEVGAKVGKALVDGIKNETAGVDFAKTLFAKSEAIATARLKAQQEQAAKLAAGNREFTLPVVADASLKDQRTIAIEEVIKKLNEEAEALQYVGRERTAHLQLIREEQSLRKKGINLTDDERQQLLVQYENIQSLKLRGQIMDEVDGKLEENARAQEVVNDLIEKGTGRTDLYIQKLQELKYQALQQNRDVASGFQRGFLSVTDEVNNFAKLSEQTVTDAFHGMEDAFVNFVKTGKLSFSSLVDSMLADLTRLVFRQAVSGLFGSIFGGANPFALLGGGVAGARAAGGPVSAGNSYLVGEHGPEIYTPHSSGTITPNGAVGAPAPQVHVHVVNVSDPKEITTALGQPANQDMILNVLRRNPKAARSALGI